LDLEYEVHGNKVHVHTIDLTAPPDQIREDVLRSCLDPVTAAQAIGQLPGKHPVGSPQAA